MLSPGAEWLFGGFGVVDVDLAFALKRVGEELPEDVAGWVARVWERPSVKEYVTHPRPPNPPIEDVNTRR